MTFRKVDMLSIMGLPLTTRALKPRSEGELGKEGAALVGNHGQLS